MQATHSGNAWTDGVSAAAGPAHDAPPTGYSRAWRNFQARRAILPALPLGRAALGGRSAARWHVRRSSPGDTNADARDRPHTPGQFIFANRAFIDPIRLRGGGGTGARPALHEWRSDRFGFHSAV